MATEPNEDDVLELGEPPEDQDEQKPEVNDQGGEPGDEEEEGEEPALPSFADAGEEEPSDTDLVKHLRAELRKTQARTRELETGQKPEPPIVVGDKPTLESCEYDEDKFESELTAYHERKRKAEEQANKGHESEVAANQQWEAEKTEYMKKRVALPFKSQVIDDAEAVVAATLDPHQVTCIVKAANNPPTLILALSRNPAKLQAVAGIKDYAKFIAAIVRLEAEVKMPTRKPAAEPDKIVRGSGSMAGGVDKHELKLQAEADRTGDRSALVKYRYDKKNAGKKAA